MQELATVDVSIKDLINGPVKVVQWTKADPFPELGRSVGVDTETELITETNSAPPLVVLGVFDPASMTCYISYWQDAAVFINRLSKCEIQQHYFNLGFDEHVLNDVDPEKALLDAIELGRVRDMQIRIQLNDIATIGFIPWNHYSLKDCSHQLLGIELDKGEADDPESHRLTFRRGTPITTEQAVYLAWDCISTEALSMVSPETPTEVQHTKGMVVLAHISHNGFPVDMEVFEAFEKKLQAQKDEYRLKLLDFGFPDPYAKQKDENGDYKRLVAEQAQKFIGAYDYGPLNLCKANIRMALVYAYNFAGEPDHVEDFEQSVAFWLTQEKPKNLRKAEQAVFNEMLGEYDQLEALFNAGKEIVMNALLAHVLEDLLRQKAEGLEHGYNLGRAFEAAGEVIDANAHWLDNEKQVGPKTFLQEHYAGLLKQYPGLELPRTPKSGDVKLSLQDMWLLEDAGVKDPFLEAHSGYSHATKYLSTYLNREFLRPDGKIHAKFTNILKTSRTSCTRPNLQNLP